MQELKERGENEQPRMVIKRRSGEKASEVMARSIVQLYLYAWSNIGTFPKQIISTASIEPLRDNKEEGANTEIRRTLTIVKLANAVT